MRKLPESQPVSVKLRNLSKSFGDQRVVKPFDMDVPPGTKVALLGPSGCGKTTTLRLIAGLESPDPGGKVYFGDTDVTEVPVEKRNIGFVFQHFALFPNMTAEENVAYGLKARKRPLAERKRITSAMLEMVKLSEFGKRRISSLSGGQKQRVALARALAAGPKVLLLDEPLAALDAILRVSLREEMEELLSNLGITTIMVTHDQDEAMALGDLIVVMKDGVVEQTGSPEEIYGKPKTAFVAGFLGGSNRLQGDLDEEYLRLPGEALIPRKELSKSILNGNGRGNGQGQGNGQGNGNGKGKGNGGGGPLENGKVSVFIRPDKAKLVPVTPGKMRGVVVSSRFVGQKTRLVVRLSEDALIKLELPTGSRDPGESVGVDLSPDELMLFREA